MDKEELIYNYLIKYHQGINNRVKGKELMLKFEINDHKTLRKIIQNINRSINYEKLIGAVSSKKGGYFICRTQEETLKAINNRRHRANQMLIECHIMNWKYNNQRNKSEE